MTPDLAATVQAEALLEQHRSELTGYCYRMLGSAFEAEDAVQETMLRAWNGLERFQGRSSLRSWLYRIATNVCFDLLNGRQRRARPMDLGPAGLAAGPVAEPNPDFPWLEPMPDGQVLPDSGDPAALAEARETVRLAFVAAMQMLPPRQRAVLLLRDVLNWRANEVADLLDTSVASVNSALQRARATLAASDAEAGDPYDPSDEEQRDLLERYLDAFERYDIDAFVALLHEDATQVMPPYDHWLVGADQIHEWMLGAGIACQGSRIRPVASTNGLPAFAQWRRDPDGDGYYAWALHVVEITSGRISGLNYFLDTERVFPMYGLPLRLEGDGRPAVAAR
ncbi:MAG TPA: sigma-70 family RNA polymerase sigma factor [Capillimicrobium sp.]|nr:sigma-70 family RNA polymerase sigma factor [Capillimicrobium sp.]